MISQSITVEDVCAILNEMLTLDRDCTETLFNNRVVCNEALADHATIQVGERPQDKNTTLGLLGIINGFFGVDSDGYGAICLEINNKDNDNFIRFVPIRNHR